LNEKNPVRHARRVFRLGRTIAVSLRQPDEPGTPAQRTKLKSKKWKRSARKVRYLHRALQAYIVARHPLVKIH
jgi:hypothetical protein